MKFLIFTAFLLAACSSCAQNQRGTETPEGGDPTAAGREECTTSEDCVLLMCSGCVNREWLRTAPPDNPCAMYEGWEGCECQDGACVEVGPPAPAEAPAATETPQGAESSAATESP